MVDKLGGSLIRLNEVAKLSSVQSTIHNNNNGNNHSSHLGINEVTAAFNVCNSSGLRLSSTSSSLLHHAAAMAPKKPSPTALVMLPDGKSAAMAPLDSRVHFLIELSAGALGGAVSRTVTAPIDRLRTVIQVESVDAANSKSVNAATMWRYMLREGRWQSLWRGNLINVIKTAPENAIRMATYERFKMLLRQKRNMKENSPEEKLLCGSLAGLVSTLTLYPLKTVKTIMNLGHTGEFRSIVQCMHSMYQKNGVRGFYRGLLANSMAIMPSCGLDLLAYETLKKRYRALRGKSSLNPLELFVLGNVSSTLGNLFVYPLIFARTRLQSNRDHSETTLKLLTKVWRRDGVFGMYRGFLLHIVKIGPAAGISYVIFEAVNKNFSITTLS